MRSAQALHSWRRITVDWDGDLRFTSLATRAIAGFDASEVSLQGGLVILAGVNSGGKSRLLRSIWAESNDPAAAATLLGWENGKPRAILYVDLFELLTRQWTAQRAPDLTEQVEAAGLTAVRQGDLRNLSYVIGREYASIRIAELEAPATEEEPASSGPPRFREEVVPYFEVSTNGNTHSSQDLSRGELSALTLHWVLQSAPTDAVLLLDEPDLMLSPLSAQRALDLVIDHANATKMPVILATHSYLGLANAPRSAQVLLRVSTSGISSLASPDDYALWDALRVAAPKQLIFVVEDEMARLLLSELLGMVDFPHLDVSEIWVGGSAAEVRAVGRLPDLRDAKIAMWGVLDGNESIGKTDNHCLRLPGDSSPEAGAIEICTSHPALITDHIKTLQRALERTMGDNAHDRVFAVAESLGMSGVSLVLRSWREWVSSTEEGRAALDLFKESLSAVTLPKSADN